MIAVVVRCDADGCEAEEVLPLTGDTLRDGLYLHVYDSVHIDGVVEGASGWKGASGTFFGDEGPPPQVFCPEHAGSAS